MNTNLPQNSGNQSFNIQSFLPATQETLEEIKKLLDADSFALETQIQNILDGMQKAGILKDYAREQIAQRLAGDIYTASMIDLVKALTDDQKKQLREIAQLGFNDYQQLVIIRKLYERASGQTIEELVMSKYDIALKQFISEYFLLKESMEDVAKLNDEECDKVEKLLDAGEFEQAIALTEKGRTQSSQDTAGDSGTQTDNQQQSSERQARQSVQPDLSAVDHITALLKAGRFEEARKEMDNMQSQVAPVPKASDDMTSYINTPPQQETDIPEVPDLEDQEPIPAITSD